jgi:carbonic anhydrase/acetyltransferase-like protein (isoleucine patch superfamily)
MILPFGDRRPVVRGDVHDFRIGARTNVQDNAPISAGKSQIGCP